MYINITTTHITPKINSFNPGYHADYFRVRALAKTYLAAASPSSSTTYPLANALVTVLKNWGAGKRKAPRCATVASITTALTCPTLHKNLKMLEKSLSHMTIVSGKRNFSSNSPFSGNARPVAAFDQCMIDTLHIISNVFFTRNTNIIQNINITYPMKALLLITGLTPAFDSNVKGGLAKAGFVGVKKTQYQIPTLATADAQKVCALPFYIADYLSHSKHNIDTAVSASNYPNNLVGEYGRIFDDLFFMHNACETKFISLSPPITPWYKI